MFRVATLREAIDAALGEPTRASAPIGVPVGGRP
jgi:hypothetical protein